jgi:hypothetical protein
MRSLEFITEAKVLPVRDQIIADIRKHGGDISEYFVRFTNQDKLGFSNKQTFKKTPDVDDPNFDFDALGQNTGRRSLWFYPAAYYLNDKYGTYATDLPYVWLVQLLPDAWLQTVNSGDRGAKIAPEGKQRVGIIRMTRPPAAIFFTYGFDVVGRYYDYAGQHKRHGEVQGRPEPSFFDRIRGQA